jgi:hypothetical protein
VPVSALVPQNRDFFVKMSSVWCTAATAPTSPSAPPGKSPRRRCASRRRVEHEFGTASPHASQHFAKAFDVVVGARAERYMARALDICERAGLDPDALIVQPFLVKQGEMGRGRGCGAGEGNRTLV